VAQVTQLGALRPTQQRTFQSLLRRVRRNEGPAYLFLLPFLIPFVTFVLAPALAGIVISFFNWSIMGTPRLVGLANYTRVINDPLFQSAVTNTLYFMLLTVPGLLILSLALALLLNQKLPIQGFVRSMIVSPRVLMVSAVGLIWGWMFNRSFGLLNYYLIQLGLPPQPWLSDPQTAMPSIAIATLWWTINGNVIIYLAGLQDIPQELYEAGRIDGASGWQLFWNITLPSMAALNAFIIPMSVIASSRVFGQIYTMTQGGPVGKTFVIVYYIYVQAFQNFHMGVASAAAVLLTIASIGFALIALRTMKVL
jgi:multiple sugar transport system permease protein